MTYSSASGRWNSNISKGSWPVHQQSCQALSRTRRGEDSSGVIHRPLLPHRHEKLKCRLLLLPMHQKLRRQEKNPALTAAHSIKVETAQRAVRERHRSRPATRAAPVRRVRWINIKDTQQKVHNYNHHDKGDVQKPPNPRIATRGKN
jgi:hypothetical protein